MTFGEWNGGAPPGGDDGNAATSAAHGGGTGGADGGDYGGGCEGKKKGGASDDEGAARPTKKSGSEAAERPKSSSRKAKQKDLPTMIPQQRKLELGLGIMPMTAVEEERVRLRRVNFVKGDAAFSTRRNTGPGSASNPGYNPAFGGGMAQAQESSAYEFSVTRTKTVWGVDGIEGERRSSTAAAIAAAAAAATSHLKKKMITTIANPIASAVRIPVPNTGAAKTSTTLVADGGITINPMLRR